MTLFVKPLPHKTHISEAPIYIQRVQWNKYDTNASVSEEATITYVVSHL